MKKEDIPLRTSLKLMYLLFFWGVFTLVMANGYKEKGYTRKYREAWKFMKIGFSISVALLILVVAVFY
jgi:uncharacterized membrane protein